MISILKRCRMLWLWDCTAPVQVDYTGIYILYFTSDNCKKAFNLLFETHLLKDQAPHPLPSALTQTTGPNRKYKQSTAGKELHSILSSGTAYVSASKGGKEIKGKIQGGSQSKHWEKSFYLSPSSNGFPEGALWTKILTRKEFGAPVWWWLCSGIPDEFSAHPPLVRLWASKGFALCTFITENAMTATLIFSPSWNSLVNNYFWLILQSKCMHV